VLDQIAAFARRLGTPSRIHVAGGEPVLCDDLVPLMRAAHARGIPFRFLTNGTLMTEGLARDLAAAGCVGVQVSIEGPEPVHDAIRGEGSLRRTLAGVERVRHQGVPITFSMTVHAGNAAHIEAVARMAADSADRVYVSRLVPYGRGGELDLLAPAAWHRAMRTILGIARAGRVDVALRDPTFRPFLLDARTARIAPAVAGCAAGYRTLTIESDGTIMACRRIGVPIGSALPEPGSDLPVGLQATWDESPQLEALRDRDRLGGECGRCAYRWVCGGCRGVANAVRSDPLAHDPQCPWHRGVAMLVEQARHRARRLAAQARWRLLGPTLRASPYPPRTPSAGI
jgi:radical SAM protein with 4Fe4S-binding SPASM domain